MVTDGTPCTDSCTCSFGDSEATFLQVVSAFLCASDAFSGLDEVSHGLNHVASFVLESLSCTIPLLQCSLKRCHPWCVFSPVPVDGIPESFPGRTIQRTHNLLVALDWSFSQSSSVRRM